MLGEIGKAEGEGCGREGTKPISLLIGKFEEMTLSGAVFDLLVFP